MPAAKESAVPHRELAPVIRKFAIWTTLLCLVSCVFHLICNFVLHTGAWAANPFWPTHDLFADFTIFERKFQHFHTAAFWTTGFPINYPAPCIVAFEFFFRYFGRWDLVAFELFCIAAFLIPAYMFASALARRGVATTSAFVLVSVLALLSWPAILIVTRGNIEVFVWLALLIGMWAYSTGRLWTAAAFFGVGASLKLFPFVLLGLFLSRRQYTKVAFGVLVFFVVSLLTLAIVGPSVSSAYQGISFGLASFKAKYMAVWLPNESGVDHSLFGFCKYISFRFFHHRASGFGRALQFYLWVVAVSGLLLYFARIRKLPLLNQVLILTIVSIYFTAFSGDGTLIHLYLPCAMLLLLAQRSWQDGVSVPGLSFVLNCMVFLLSCETFLVHDNQRYIGPAHCIGIGALLIAAFTFPLGPPLEETASERILSEPQTAWVGSVAPRNR